MTPEFLLTSLVLCITPGTGVLFTLAAGLSRGARASLVAAAGCTLGIIPHVLAALTGVAAVMHTSAVAFETLKYAGVAYLLYMAWRTFRDTGALVVEQDRETPGHLQVVASAVLVNLLNPKLTIFFFAFLPQFVSPESPGATGEMLRLSLVFMGMTFAVFAVYGVFASAAREYVIARPRVTAWFRRSFAAAFALMGARLAFERR